MKAIGLLLISSSLAPAAVLEVTLTFSSINLTYNGVPNTPSGDVTVVATLDTGNADIESNANFGIFEADTAVITSPTLGLSNVPFATSVFLTTEQSEGNDIGLSFGGNFANRKGLWNYQNLTPSYSMTDVNDLSTLTVPYNGGNSATSNLQFLSTLGGGAPINLSSGDFFDIQNSSPGVGNVTVGGSIAVIPEPSSMLLLLSSMLLLGRRSRVLHR